MKMGYASSYLVLEEHEPDGDGKADDTPETKVSAKR
jgi:hypothetical protein